MTRSKWTVWAGISAVAGGGLAILLTVPFAAAYFRAYSGLDPTPIWLAALQPIVRPLLSFGQPISVYNAYGRIYDLVYLLFFPAALALHHLHRPLDSRFEKWVFWLTVVGLIASFVGVAGDYWADGAGFVIELVGLFVFAMGATLSGIVLLRSRILPRWTAWLFLLCLPGYFIWFILIGHIPSGPSFGIALAYIGLGCVLLLNKYTTPHVQEQRAAYQLDGAAPASCGESNGCSIEELTGRLISRPLGDGTSACDPSLS